jgi:pimeloyl-ACP methyl ester carboxylesterase
MAFITVNSANLYYEDEGHGAETIVFSHSMLFNLRMFDDQVEALKSSYRCVRFDFRGQGKSEVTEGGYNLDNLANDTAELIEKLECIPCHFVGFSMGGMVGMRIAARRPDLIRSLILIDTSSEPDSPIHRLRNRALLWTARNLGLRPVASRVIKMFFGQNALRDPGRQHIRKTWKMHFLSNDRTGISKAVQGVISRNGITSELVNIRCPALILWGEEDRLTDKKKAEMMQVHIDNSTLKIIPGAGHMSTVEEPAFINKAIIDFLRAIGQ